MPQKIPCKIADILRLNDERIMIQNHPLSLRDLCNKIPTRVAEFMVPNKFIFETAVNRSMSIYKKYYQMEEDGEKFKQTEKGDLILIEGKTEEEYAKEMEEYCKLDAYVIV